MRRRLVSVGLSLVAVTVLCGAAPEIKPAGSPEPWLRWVSNRESLSGCGEESSGERV